MSLNFLSWPLIAWLLIWLGWPLLSPIVRRWLQGRSESAAFWYAEIEPWVHGLVPPYAAWLLGWLPARLLGFTGRGGWPGWLLVGLILLGILFFYWRKLLPSLKLSKLKFRPDHAMLDEPRWALYRGVAWFLLWDVWWGALLGLLLMLIEWALIHRAWQAEQRQDELVCFDLARRATSTLAFALSANLWLTMVFQAGLLWPLIDGDRDQGKGQ